jgi:hypothetical protein
MKWQKGKKWVAEKNGGSFTRLQQFLLGPAPSR